MFDNNMICGYNRTFKNVLTIEGNIMETKSKALLIILDGYGISESHEGNAVYSANPDFINKLFAERPFTKLAASGLAVGLPEGQMGNSEVGHLNIGAGRIVYQDITRINKSIQELYKK